MVKTLHLDGRGCKFQPVVGEVRSCMLCGGAKLFLKINLPQVGECLLGDQNLCVYVCRCVRESGKFSLICPT